MQELNSIEKAIRLLTSENETCKTLVSELDENDYVDSDVDWDLESKEYIEWMAESGYDVVSPRHFRFEMTTFKDIEQATNVKREINEMGYEVYMHIFEEKIYIFQVLADIKPSLNLVLEIEHTLQAIVLKYGLEYMGFRIHNIENA